MPYLPIKNISDKSTIYNARTEAIRALEMHFPGFSKNPHHKEIALDVVIKVARAFEINVIHS